MSNVVKIDEPQQAGKDLLEKARHEIVTECLLQGNTYTDWLQWFHKTIKPSNYLEIGTNTGRSLQYANNITNCIGVDPNPVTEIELDGNTKIFEETSDQFFANNDVNKVMQGPIEFAFVDGLHHYDQVLTDFINIEKYSTKDTIVLFHDVFPVVPATATREWNTFYWAGDTWKFMHIIDKYRPDLVVRTIPTFPTGLGFITNLDPVPNPVLEDNFDHIVKEFAELEYDIGNPINLIKNEYKGFFSA